MDHFISICEIFNLKGTIFDDQYVVETQGVKLIHKIDDKSKKITVETSDCNSFHTLRVILNMIKLNKDEWFSPNIDINMTGAYDYIKALNDVVNSNIFDYCTICGTIHDNKGLGYITACLNPKCMVKIYHYPTSNKITSLYKSDSNTFVLLYQFFLSILTHQHVNDFVKTLPKIYGVNDVKKLISVVPPQHIANDIEPLLNIIADSFDDFFLWVKLDNNTLYAIILNSISDNYYSIHSFKDLVNNDLKKKVIDNTNLEFFDIKYSTEVETVISSKLETEGKKYYYLFHGSPFYCWYSIIKNGLKNMSNTKYMTTGAAYGPGIYLSDNCSVSCGYARQCPPFNFSVIGLFQVIENPIKYQKAPAFFVIENEKLLVLRSLVKINPSKDKGAHLHTYGYPGNNMFEQINNYFIHQRSIDKSVSDKNLIALTNKRLIAELNHIKKFPEKFNVVEFFDNLELPWKIEIYSKSSVYTVIVSFHKYPLSPPLFTMDKFVLPVKGIITSTHSINLPLLEPGNWNVSKKIIDVLQNIWSFLDTNY
jgi:hypothetical protein